jgi:hypothetical protein
LLIEFRNRLFQYLAMTRVCGGLKLLREPLSGKQQALASPVTLLLFGRDWSADSFSALRHFRLLLLYGFTLPPACHRSILPWSSRSYLDKTDN